SKSLAGLNKEQVIFFLSVFISVTAFWSEEIWATRWLFGIVFLEFLAGAFFPIDVLPSWLSRIIYLTPFPYLVFFPLKVWLEQLSLILIYKAIIVCSLWLVVFYFLAKWLWQKGVKNYGAYGG
ncbi:ABC-2 family transporter protein, partial [Patescibacteria group bacterium]